MHEKFFGSLSLSFGIIAMVFHWLTILPPPYGIIVYSPILIFGIISVTAGFVSAKGFLIHNCSQKNPQGFLGLILGVASIILSTGLLIISTLLIW